MAHWQRAGLMVAADTYTVSMRAGILKSAEQHHVPLICPYRQFVLARGLMSYGPDTSEIFRRSSSYVDRILKVNERATCRCNHRISSNSKSILRRPKLSIFRYANPFCSWLTM